jgi:hypothetical protein
VRENRSECVKYHARPEHAAKVKALAEERGISVSSLIFEILIDHLRQKLAAEQDPARRAEIQKAIDSSTGPIDRPRRLPTIRHYDVPGGFVYFVKCGGFYKIGRAKNLKQRLGGMQFPEKPRLIKAVHCLDYGFLEKAMHALFAHKRAHGEWFSLTEEEVQLAKEYMASRA